MIDRALRLPRTCVRCSWADDKGSFSGVDERAFYDASIALTQELRAWLIIEPQMDGEAVCYEHCLASQRAYQSKIPIAVLESAP